MTTLEKAARAAYDAYCEAWAKNTRGSSYVTYPWGGISEAERQQYVAFAAAVLRTIRKPDEGMVRAIWLAQRDDTDLTDMEIEHHWQTGIDSILLDATTNAPG